jgi:hypothetical protein
MARHAQPPFSLGWNAMNQSFSRGRAFAVVLGLLGAWSAAAPAHGCPFCNAAMQTLSQEIENASVAVIAQLIEPMPTSADGLPGSESAAARFRVVEVLRGGDQLAGAKEIEVVYFGDDDPSKRFFITGLAGVTGPGLDWTNPVPLSPRAVDYFLKLASVPATGVDRLAFFQEYLEDDDPLLAQDAYDEFARTPYDQVIELGPRMKRQQLLEWIQDPGVGPTGRRLYLTMLSICGKPEDVRLLEELMNYDYGAMQPAIAAAAAVGAALYPSAGAGLADEMIHAEERRKRESLDALVACYLKLKGPSGLELINKLFLGNPQVEYKHLHAAIMALRFHGEQTDILPREALLASMRLALDHDGFADQVIPDLSRWEDWEVMPRLVEMFRNSPTGDWIRLPVASYLLVAADVDGEVGERAKAAIAELEPMDATTFADARRNSAFGFLSRAASSPASSGGQGGTTAAATDANGAPAVDPSVPGVPAGTGPTAATVGGGAPEAVADAAPPKPAASTPLAATAVTPPSKIKIIGIPLLAVGVLLAIFAVLLRGADPRSSDENP